MTGAPGGVLFAALDSAGNDTSRRNAWLAGGIVFGVAYRATTGELSRWRQLYP